jgi:diamine N-acetyltransferase
LIGSAVLIDERYQGRGYATAVVRAEGATELLTSYVPEDDRFAGFCRRLGVRADGRARRQGRGHRAARVALW